MSLSTKLGKLDYNLSLKGSGLLGSGYSYNSVHTTAPSFCLTLFT